MIDCFFSDFNKYCVPMKKAYDGEKLEPEFLKKNHYRVIDNANKVNCWKPLRDNCTNV